MHHHPPPGAGGRVRLQRAVLCPSAATGGGCPFDVVVVFVRQRRAFACVYSSRTAAWGERVSIPTPSPHCELSEESGALVGGALYWLLGESSILEFRLGDQRLALIHRPLEKFSVYKRNIRVVRSEGGELGLVAVKNFILHFWAREADFDQGSAEWVLHREIEVAKLLELPLTQPRVGSIPVWIGGIGEDGNVVFLRIMVGIFMVWPETMQFKMITNNVLIKTVYLYATFYVLEGNNNYPSLLPLNNVPCVRALLPEPEQKRLQVSENKRRQSTFKGIVIGRHNAGINTTLRLRRLVSGVGFDYLPNIEEIKILDPKKVKLSSTT